MLSFNNDPSLKALHVAQAEQHAAADMLMAGTFGAMDGDTFKGCYVGCFAHEIDPTTGNYHEVVASNRGLPEWLVRLQDSMFEGLPAEDRPSFHVELARRIPVGVNLEPVQHWIAIARIDRLLTIQRKSLEANHAHGVHEAVQQTIAALEVGRRAHEAAAGGNTCELSAAAWSAESAAESAARSAAWSAARSAAWSARSAAWSAESAAWSAARSARSARSAAWSAESAAWSAGWREERDALFAALDKAAQQ